MRADLEKLAQVIRPTTEDESRAAALDEADAGLVEQRRNRLRRIADEMGDLPAREALWHYARSVGDMHGEIENSIQESVEQRWLAESSDALESSNVFIEEHGLPLAQDDSVTKQVQADYARMQHPVFRAMSNLLEGTVPERGFGKFRGGPPPEPDDAKKNE